MIEVRAAEPADAVVLGEIHGFYGHPEGWGRKCGFTETGAQRSLDFGDGNPLVQVEYERACAP